MNFNEEQVLLSLWKWKLLSTAALTELHFRDIAPSTAYYNLWLMEKKNLIHLIPIPGKGTARAFMWTLSLKGFREIKECLPELKNDGYKSESIRHDYLVSAIHIGEWLGEIPIGCELFSEQELRTLHIDQYPDWVPKVDFHRPDGYWLTKIGDQSGVIALEVELTRKSGFAYRGTGQFYSNRKNVFRIIWVVPTPGLATHIQKEIKTVAPDGYLAHNFILLKDFEKNGWNAKFILGEEQGYPLKALLGFGSQTSAKHVWSNVMLNTLKSPHRTQSYNGYLKLLKSDRVGTYNLLTPPSKNISNIAPITQKLHSTTNSNTGENP